MTEDEAKQQLKEQYDGYHFVEDSEDIYNPFSLLNTFAKMKFGSYWFETGTPTFLVELLQRSKYDLHRLTEEMATADSLGGIDTMETNPVPILYQSGYLTIKGFDNRFRTYTLGFPNLEVEEGFIRFLLPFYSNTSKSDSAFEIVHLSAKWKAVTSMPSCYASRASLPIRPTSWHATWNGTTRTCSSLSSGCWVSTPRLNTTRPTAA